MKEDRRDPPDSDMKQPLAGVVGLFAAGIVLGALRVPSLPLLLLGTIFAAMWVLPATRWTQPALGICLVLAGWSDLGWRMAILSPHDLRRIVASPETLAEIRGSLCVSPEIRIHETAGRRHTNSLAILECETARLGRRDWQPAVGRVMVSAPGLLPGLFRRGARVEIAGVLRPPDGPAAPGAFDHAGYLRWRGIFFELRTTDAADWRLAGGHPPVIGWSERFGDWARTILARGLNPADEEVDALNAMALGWKSGLTDDVKEPFMRSGTMHVFAISGLHIGLLATFTTQLLRLLPMSRGAAGGVVLPVVWFYTAATGWQPSAIRATVMISVVMGGWMLARPADLLNSLAGAALILLAWDPRQLFHAGFQLSFAVVGALGLLLPEFDSLRRRLFALDPFLPRELASAWRRTLEGAGWWVCGSVAVAVSAWIGSLPLAAHHFHLVTPSSLVTNLAVVPLSSLALASSLGSLACGAWAPGVSELFNHGAWFWMRLTLAVSRWAAQVPGGYWYVRQPPMPATVLWYLLLVVGTRRWWRRPALRIALVIATALLAGTAGYVYTDRAREARVVVLPLGGGHAVWVHQDGESLLVDTGDAVAAAWITRPFLQAQGVNRLKSLVLTHGDVRHVGGAPGIAGEFSPSELVVSPLKFRSQAYRRVLEDLGRLVPNRLVRLDDGARVADSIVRHPEATDRVGRADDGSMVLDVGLGGSRVLLVADLGREGLRRLRLRHPELRADIVVAGLADHGEPVSAGFVAALGASLWIVADARRPVTASASAEVKARLRRSSVPVLFTSDTGALDLRWDRGLWRITDAQGRPIQIPPVVQETTPTGITSPGHGDDNE